LIELKKVKKKVIVIFNILNKLELERLSVFMGEGKGIVNRIKDHN